MRVSTSKLTYVVFHMSLLQVAWGLTLVAQVCQKTFDYIIRVHIHVLLHAFATKLPGGHPIRGPKFGARLLWHRYAKKHLITSSSFTYMCFYMPLLQSCLGALCSGPEVRGPTLVAQVCQKSFDYIIRGSHTCASTCLCYKVAWGHSVRGPKFGARLLWHSYAKKHLITSSEFTYMCFYVHAFATKLKPMFAPFAAPPT